MDGSDEWNPLARALRKQQQTAPTSYSRIPEPSDPYRRRSRSPSPRSLNSHGVDSRSDFPQDRYREPRSAYSQVPVDSHYQRRDHQGQPAYPSDQRSPVQQRDLSRASDRRPLLDDFYAFRPALVSRGPEPIHSEYQPIRRRDPSPPLRQPPASSDYQPFPLSGGPDRRHHNENFAPIHTYENRPDQRKRGLEDEFDRVPRRGDLRDNDLPGQRKLFQDAVRSALLMDVDDRLPPKPTFNEPRSARDDYPQSDGRFPDIHVARSEPNSLMDNYPPLERRYQQDVRPSKTELVRSRDGYPQPERHMHGDLRPAENEFPGPRGDFSSPENRFQGNLQPVRTELPRPTQSYSHPEQLLREDVRPTAAEAGLSRPSDGYSQSEKRFPEDFRTTESDVQRPRDDYSQAPLEGFPTAHPVNSTALGTEIPKGVPVAMESAPLRGQLASAPLVAEKVSRPVVPEERSFMALQRAVRVSKEEAEKRVEEQKSNGFGLSKKDKIPVTPVKQSPQTQLSSTVTSVMQQSPSKPQTESKVEPVVPKGLQQPGASKPGPPPAPLFPSAGNIQSAAAKSTTESKGWVDTYPETEETVPEEPTAPVYTAPKPSPPKSKPLVSLLPEPAPLFPLLRSEKAALLHYPSDEPVLRMDACPTGLDNPLLQASPPPLCRPGMSNPLLDFPRKPLLPMFGQPLIAELPRQQINRTMDYGDTDYRRPEPYNDRDREYYDRRNGHEQRVGEMHGGYHTTAEERYGYDERRGGDFRPVDDRDGYRHEPRDDYRYPAEQRRPDPPRPLDGSDAPRARPEDPALEEFYQQLAARSSSFAGDIFAVNDQLPPRRSIGDPTGSRNESVRNAESENDRQTGQRHNAMTSPDEIQTVEMEDAFSSGANQPNSGADSRADSQTPRWVEGFSVSDSVSPPTKRANIASRSCRVCNVDFGSSEELVAHIRTREHIQACGPVKPTTVDSSQFRPVGGRYYY
ncbi:uncharacterized protein LOC129587449 isoform X2 [Paramacrobiotus metropolitanus]|uniref:uncharacterized protein LOC129587449 isoform X2 n=1 Tax=Paramacrobiotus metropolitanus TaxID=2943436 RepID=UPI0024463D7A|nr:uncharacterized protein LOC129587449 isoform X2 [Paramacrobiotus metropolitanus]